MMAAIRHVALVVRDLDASFEFYHGLFGFQQVRHRPGRAIHLSDGFFNLTLLGKRERTADEIKNDIEIDSAGEIGFSHFGFQVDRLPTVLSRLSQLGLAVSARKRPQDGRFVEERINDPEGNRVDLSENGFGTAGTKGTTGISHLTVRAANPTTLADFYHRALELRPEAGEAGTFLLRDNDLCLRLLPAAKDRSPGLAAIGVRVPSIEPFADEIAKPHAQMESSLESSKSCIHDPDGNTVELMPSR